MGREKISVEKLKTCRGPYGGQDPSLLGNQPFNGSLANALADSLGLTPNLSAPPQSQSLNGGLPGSNGGLPFNMNGLPNGGGRHPIDSLSAVSHHVWLQPRDRWWCMLQAKEEACLMQPDVPCEPMSALWCRTRHVCCRANAGIP